MRAYQRLLEYVKIDTQSVPESTSTPSSAKQLNLAKLLVQQLHDLGVDCAMCDEYGVVYAHIDANSDIKTRIGFIAHMDTAPDCSGTNVKPRIIENYDGKDIVLNDHRIMKVKDFEYLKKYQGKDLMVSDGTTLLGADDKAGVAEIMTLVEQLQNDPTIKHGYIGIAFTCDEEVGRGADHFDLERFNCDFAYTVDGGDIEAVEYENFNACSAIVKVIGKSIHPGSAKNKMVNALNVFYQFHSLLPVNLRPEYTEGYEGFNHLLQLEGDVQKATGEYIIRNHDRELFEKQKQCFKDNQAYLNQQYGYQLIEVELQDTYYNMKELFKDKMEIVNRAYRAIEKVGLVSRSDAIRGGTDGARLTYEGLCCPNLGTGGGNYHGPYEYVCIQDMDMMVEILKNIISEVEK